MTPLLTIEWWIFAGSPDPVWSLSQDRSKRLLELLPPASTREMTQEPAHVPFEYYGFTIMGLQLADDPGSLRVFDRVIWGSIRGKSVAFVDSRGAESFLLNDARERFPEYVRGLKLSDKIQKDS